MSSDLSSVVNGGEKYSITEGKSTVKVEMFTGWIFSRVKTSRTHNFAEKNQREDKNQFEYAKILPSQRNGLAI